MVQLFLNFHFTGIFQILNCIQIFKHMFIGFLAVSWFCHVWWSDYSKSGIEIHTLVKEFCLWEAKVTNAWCNYCNER